jgi:hypothetical protein
MTATAVIDHPAAPAGPHKLITAGDVVNSAQHLQAAAPAGASCVPGQEICRAAGLSGASASACVVAGGHV